MVTTQVARRTVFLSLLVVSCLRAPASAQEGWAARGDPTPSKWRAAGETMRVRLIDASNGDPVAHQRVVALRDTGVRCFLPPCPSSVDDWSGTSDAAGMVTIPTAALYRHTYIQVRGFAWLPFDVAGRPTTDGAAADLIPTAEMSGGRPLQLMDAHGVPVPLLEVGVRHGRHATELVTSPVGYIFIPHDIIYAGDDLVVSLEPRGHRALRVDLDTSIERVTVVRGTAADRPASKGRARPR